MKTRERLQTIYELESECRDAERMCRIFSPLVLSGQIDYFRAKHARLAEEHEKLRYWWMRHIKPIAY